MKFSKVDYAIAVFLVIVMLYITWQLLRVPQASPIQP